MVLAQRGDEAREEGDLDEDRASGAGGEGRTQLRLSVPERKAPEGSKACSGKEFASIGRHPSANGAKRPYVDTLRVRDQPSITCSQPAAVKIEQAIAVGEYEDSRASPVHSPQL